jgi:hypothetical protein
MGNISVLRCDFNETDEALKTVENIVSSLVHVKKCIIYATSIFCHYLYQDCDQLPSRPTANDCMKVRDDFCKGLWETASTFIASSSLGKCFAMPNCSRDFSSSSTSILFPGATLSPSTEQRLTSKTTTTKSTSAAARFQAKLLTEFFHVVCFFVVITLIQ